MTDTATTKASQVRASVGHPIVDADGHFVEISPLLNDEVVSYVEEIGGAALRERYLGAGKGRGMFDTSSALADRQSPEVREQWKAMPSWWGWQTRNTLDRGTAHLPKLLYERLDELGIDVTILYPSMSLGFLDTVDEELAGVLCRATNRYLARLFEPYRDRMVVGGLVPMITPDVAVAEARHAVRELGLKTLVISGHARRDLPGGGYRLDTYGIDSDHDYDPFWAACVELGVAPVSHSSLQHHRVTRSVSNYVYNHVGGLGAAHESLCKSLFLGGVTRRFPDLRIGFLEGGVAWACSLFADLVGHWSKRNAEEIQQLDPSRLDVPALMELMDRYGDGDVQANRQRIADYFSLPPARPDRLDEFQACRIEDEADIRELFVPSFYFGVEADDPLVTWAFRDDVNPLGARLRPIIGSDIAHWDVQDFTEPIEEAYELVERGTLGEREFRELTFLNPARLHAGMNPAFFDGTVCESAITPSVREEIADRS